MTPDSEKGAGENRADLTKLGVAMFAAGFLFCALIWAGVALLDVGPAECASRAEATGESRAPEVLPNAPPEGVAP